LSDKPRFSVGKKVRARRERFIGVGEGRMEVGNGK
jgi:hypothetical protein